MSSFREEQNQTTKKPAPAYKERFALVHRRLRKTEIQTGDHIAYEIRRKASSDSRKTVDFGVYLGSETERVLLPKKQVPSGIEVGDPIEVFLYKDSSGPDHRDNAGT